LGATIIQYQNLHSSISAFSFSVEYQGFRNFFLSLNIDQGKKAVKGTIRPTKPLELMLRPSY
jgi:hypothetical protein